ncbi:hypothetical protein EB844_02645 [Paracoccus pantotrophus]|nr:hypothetical protein EB844_02645 [Paracoccus pantotrophus]
MRGENGTLWGEGRDDILHGGNGDDRLNGQNGNDSLLGEDGRDRMNSEVGIAAPTGGEGPEALIADGAANIVTDFNAAEGIGDSRQLDNNPVDLSAFDHEQTLVAWNVAHLCQRFSSPLVCKRDERSQGALSSAGRYRIHADCNLATNAGSHMPAEQLNVENTAAPCFIKGAVIATDNGDISIENLQLDDLVKAKDNRLRSIRWMNSQGPDPGELMWPPNSRAIRIARAATRCQ